MPSVDLPASLDHWVSAGLISATQADLIRVDAGATATASAPPVAPTGETTADPADSGRPPVLAEAAAYIGIIAMLAAAGLAGGAFQGRFGPNAAVAAVLTAGFWGAAAAVPDWRGSAPGRIRSALLFASLLPLAELIALSTGLGLGWAIREVAIATAATTLAAAAVLWRLHRRLPQQGAVLLYATATVGLATTFLARDSLWLAGSAVWAVGAIWFLLARGGVVAPRRGGTVLGAIAAIVGAELVLGTGTSVLALGTVLAVVLLAVAFRDLILLVVATAGCLLVLPEAFGRLFGSLATPAVLLAAAGALLVAGVLVAGRRRDAAAPAVRDWSSGSRRAAILLSVAIAAAVTAVITTAGL